MPELVVPLIRTGFLTLEVDGSITLPKFYNLIEIDATSGNIIITLPLITHVFRNKGTILFKRIDTTSNTVTFVGTNGNYEDENLQLGNEPELETTMIYASNANIWRTV